MNRIASIINTLYFRIRFLRQIAWALIVLLAGLIIYMVIPFGRDQVVTQPVGWESRLYVTPAGFTVKSMKSSSRGNFIAIVFDGALKGTRGVFAALSFNGGGSFLEPVRIAEVNSEIDISPDVAVSSTGQVSVIWHNLADEEATNRLYLSRSEDMGPRW